MLGEMSSPIHECSWAVKISPERPDPQPMSRMKDGWSSARSSKARWVMEAWMFWMREEVVYLADSVSS